jgi:hypothetical protein
MNQAGKEFDKMELQRGRKIGRKLKKREREEDGTDRQTEQHTHIQSRWLENRDCGTMPSLCSYPFAPRERESESERERACVSDSRGGDGSCLEIRRQHPTPPTPAIWLPHTLRQATSTPTPTSSSPTPPTLSSRHTFYRQTLSHISI